ncbi:MAG: hypothetical protein SFW36_08015 [Leptolyngbyaceae cyanobacterium bins.59]|nr:hypothetical protein [Leptolyngbyaceae cyanobacterium bins.59]
MHSLFSPPQPFERLQVTDGLLINADRWRMAHAYHRKRQNIHFQSLSEPGIVSGLGVCVIPAPEDIPTQYRDGRWLQIQPGVAIDRLGNPIVVPQPIEFRISATPLPGHPIWVYVAISYVDPDQLERRSEVEVVQETFRIEERQTPPDDLEVELCRIFLQPDVETLQPATNVFAPGENQLDLRYRATAQTRSQATVRVSVVSDASPIPSPLVSNLSWLLRSLPNFCPVLQGRGKVDRVLLSDPSALAPYDLIAMSDPPSRSFSNAELERLRTYLETGGMLLIEVAVKGTQLEGLLNVQQELRQEIGRLKSTNLGDGEQISGELSSLLQSLESELAETRVTLQERINDRAQVFYQLAQQMGTTLTRWEDLDRTHPLRTEPFLFAAPPSIHQRPIQILYGDGVLLVIGELSNAWGMDDELPLPRETIRTAQEMGANLLHFAHRRKHLTQLQATQHRE